MADLSPTLRSTVPGHDPTYQSVPRTTSYYESLSTKPARIFVRYSRLPEHWCWIATFDGFPGDSPEAGVMGRGSSDVMAVVDLVNQAGYSDAHKGDPNRHAILPEFDKGYWSARKMSAVEILERMARNS